MVAVVNRPVERLVIEGPTAPARMAGGVIEKYLDPALGKTRPGRKAGEARADDVNAAW